MLFRSGNVNVQKGEDKIESYRATILLDKKRKPLVVKLEGNVKFSILTEDKRVINGVSNRAIYDVESKDYKLYGDVVLVEDGKPNTIRGEEIIVNNERGFANITGGGQKPAKMTFTLDENDKDKSKNSGKKE